MDTPFRRRYARWSPLQQMVVDNAVQVVIKREAPMQHAIFEAVELFGLSYAAAAETLPFCSRDPKQRLEAARVYHHRGRCALRALVGDWVDYDPPEDRGPRPE